MMCLGIVCSIYFSMFKQAFRLRCAFACITPRFVFVAFPSSLAACACDLLLSMTKRESSRSAMSAECDDAPQSPFRSRCRVAEEATEALVVVSRYVNRDWHCTHCDRPSAVCGGSCFIAAGPAYGASAESGQSAAPNAVTYMDAIPQAAFQAPTMPNVVTFMDMIGDRIYAHSALASKSPIYLIMICINSTESKSCLTAVCRRLNAFFTADGGLAIPGAVPGTISFMGLPRFRSSSRSRCSSPSSPTAVPSDRSSESSASSAARQFVGLAVRPPAAAMDLDPDSQSVERRCPDGDLSLAELARWAEERRERLGYVRQGLGGIGPDGIPFSVFGGAVFQLVPVDDPSLTELARSDVIRRATVFTSDQSGAGGANVSGVSIDDVVEQQVVDALEEHIFGDSSGNEGGDTRLASLEEELGNIVRDWIQRGGDNTDSDTADTDAYEAYDDFDDESDDDFTAVTFDNPEPDAEEEPTPPSPPPSEMGPESDAEMQSEQSDHEPLAEPSPWSPDHSDSDESGWGTESNPGVRRVEAWAERIERRERRERLHEFVNDRS